MVKELATSAPRSIPSDCLRVNIFALANPTSMTDVADDDCVISVAPIPAIKAKSRCRVMNAMKFLMCEPPRRFRFLLPICMP